jgi:hypothetical protein
MPANVSKKSRQKTWSQPRYIPRSSLIVTLGFYCIHLDLHKIIPSASPFVA